MASRIAARSTIAGTPVKSCSRTRDGMNGTSASVSEPGRHDASVSTSAGSMRPPPAFRRAFSRRMRSVTGALSRSIRSPSAASRQ